MKKTDSTCASGYQIECHQWIRNQILPYISHCDTRLCQNPRKSSWQESILTCLKFIVIPLIYRKHIRHTICAWWHHKLSASLEVPQTKKIFNLIFMVVLPNHFPRKEVQRNSTTTQHSQTTLQSLIKDKRLPKRLRCRSI